MPRTLVLLRHAKSGYPAGVRDHDRPLAPRGEHEAVLAGRWLREEGPALDLALVSTAERTRQTWGLVSAELDPSPERRLEPRIYEAHARDLLDVVAGVEDAVQSVLLVGHNPGLEDLATDLAGSTHGDALTRLRGKFPTSAIAVLQWAGSWGVVAPGYADLVDFAVPRD